MWWGFSPIAAILGFVVVPTIQGQRAGLDVWTSDLPGAGHRTGLALGGEHLRRRRRLQPCLRGGVGRRRVDINALA